MLEQKVCTLCLIEIDKANIESSKEETTTPDFEQELCGDCLDIRKLMEYRFEKKDFFLKYEKELLNNIKTRKTELESLLKKANSKLRYEDPVYRFYHHSFKVYYLQELTDAIVQELNTIKPLGAPLNPYFRCIIREGTGKKFEPLHNQRWLQETRPIIEAFFHAKYMLEMAIKYGVKLGEPPRPLQSGYAALLYLYNLR